MLDRRHKEYIDVGVFSNDKVRRRLCFYLTADPLVDGFAIAFERSLFENRTRLIIANHQGFLTGFPNDIIRHSSKSLQVGDTVV
jgi:hypothetical protein